MAKKDTSVLAIDIGGGCLKMAEFSFPESGGIVLERFGFRDLGDRELDPAWAFSEAYHQLLKEIPFKSKNVRLSISGQVSFSRLSKLPKLTGNSSAIGKIVEFEASQVVPYPMNEVVWGYQLLSHKVKVEHVFEPVIGGDAPTVEVEEVDEFEALFVAAKNEQVTAFTDVIINSGRKVLSVDTAPLAMFNAARASQQGDQSSLLLNIGARNTSLIICSGDRIFVRSIPIAGDTVTSQIAKEFGIPFEEAEDLKRRHGFVALGGAYEEPESEVAATISKIARNVMTRLHGEINRSISVWRSQHGGAPPVKLTLSGGGALMFYTQEFFKEKLRFAVDYLNVFSSGVALGKEVDRQELVAVAPMFSELVGTSLRELVSCPVDISLMPKQLKFQQDFMRKRPFFYASAVLVIACLVSCLMAIRYSAAYSESLVGKTQGGVEATESMRDQVAAVYNEANGAKSDYMQGLELLANRGKWVDMLNELQSMIPDNMWLVALEGKGTEFVPAVESDSEGDGMDMGVDMSMDAFVDDPLMENEQPKEDHITRLKAAYTTDVSELRLRFYTLTMPTDDMVEEKFREALKTSKFFVNEKEGFSILTWEGGTGKDNLKSFIVMLKLKEPITK
ncbi:MAG: pilus assembly protein PilM [Lentisphaeria bacterium]|nr:pilus assembly protein PilM [Lentisphaeria bacterium]